MAFPESDQTVRPSERPAVALTPSAAVDGPGPEVRAAALPGDILPDLSESDARTWLIPLAGVLVAIVLSVVFWRALPTPHMTLEVFNDTGAPMSNVRFKYAGGRGSRMCETIAAGATISWEITEKSQGFILEYRDPNRQVVTRKCDLALDGDDWGTMTLHVRHGGMKVLTEVDPPSPVPNH